MGHDHEGRPGRPVGRDAGIEGPRGPLRTGDAAHGGSSRIAAPGGGRLNAVGSFLDKVDYLSLGERLPGLVEELSAILDGRDGAIRREAAERLTHASVAAKSMAYRLGYVVDLVSVAVERATWAARETDKPEL